MSWVDEALTKQFHQWELRGRGWHVFDSPVSPEPPFVPFYGHLLPAQLPVDDGKRPTIVSGLLEKAGKLLRGETEPEPPVLEEEPEPTVLNRGPLIELQALLPADFKVGRDEFEQFMMGLSLCLEPITFELVGSFAQVALQFAVHPGDLPLMEGQLQAFFPDTVFLRSEGALKEAWGSSDYDDDSVIVEFGLGREFMIPLETGKLDPFVSILGALSGLDAGEFGLYQVSMMPTRKPWALSTLQAVTDNEGRAFFVNEPELLSETRRKLALPLYAAVVRIAGKSPQANRSWDIVRHLASSLAVFSRPDGNELIPLKNDNYPLTFHVEDLLLRQCRRSGMILNGEELSGFVHLPLVDVRSPVLKRQTSRSKAYPKQLRNTPGLLLGENVHAGRTVQVFLNPDQRVRHVHVIGTSGTGKSTLLFNMIQEDILHGEGVALLDPHGDLVERILGSIPEHRVKDVVLLDPADEEFSIGFNILSAHSELEKTLLASDLVSVFWRLSTSWGDQMTSVLNNAILAFLESDRGGTLADLRRFLLESKYREKLLGTVRDPDVVYYWRKGFAQLAGNKSVGPILTRLDTFLGRKPIRYMVSQKTNKLDFANILDTGKIFLAKLSQGALGRENSYLLGTLLVAKIQQLAMSRQAQVAASRRQFWLYIDEFHNFITPTMAEILAGVRKYRLGLILAHQELRQLERDREVASAVLSNPYTRICFRVGDEDARKLASGFSYFEAKDLQNLGTGEAICRVERSDFDFNLTVPLPSESDSSEADQRKAEIVKASRERYGTPRAEIESTLREESIEWNKQAHRPEKEDPCTTTQARPIAPQPIVAPPQPSHETPPAPSVTPPNDTSPTDPTATKSVSVPIPAEIATASIAAPLEALKAPRITQGELGRGGAQHQLIQKRLKSVAEGLGYRASIEKDVLDGQGSIDLALVSPQRSIACEISITTTLDHEVGNVAKCLKAGFQNVAVICLTTKRLEQIRSAVEGSIGADRSSGVIYHTPDQFIAQLQEWALLDEKAKAQSEPKRNRGYLVKRTVATLTRDEAKAREEVAFKALADTMSKKKK